METHPSVFQISETMRSKRIDNFRVWREEMKIIGIIKSEYPPLVHNGDLAELIGVTLGDGHICKYPRTEELRIISNASNLGFVERYSNLIKNVFKKQPMVRKSGQNNSIIISIYQKQISKRMNIPSGARGALEHPIPAWISKNPEFVVRYLRGLYEAEGCFCVHKPTSTYKLFFTNRNLSLLDNVYFSLQKLGFHPHRSKDQVQLSRKAEVYKAIEVLGFRKY